MSIHIKIIPHNEQRYDTVGDWVFDENGSLTITVSDMHNEKYEFLVAFHELIEVMLCKTRGISQESVDAFDKRFEEMRVAFPEIVGNREPGNSGAAPYKKEHQFATKLEARMAHQLGVDWKEYNNAVNNL